MSTTTQGSGSKLHNTQGIRPGNQDRVGPWWRTWIGLSALALLCTVPASIAVTLINDNFRISEASSVDVDRDAVRSAIAYNPTDGEYLIVWEADELEDDLNTTPQTLNDDVDEIFGRRVNAVTGELIGNDFRISNMSSGALGEVAAEPGKTDQAANPAVTYNSSANEYLVVWQGGGCNVDTIYGQRLSWDGTQLDVNFPISDVSDSTPPNLLVTVVGGSTVPVVSGQVVRYELRFENVGNREATGVTLFDTVPANSTFLASGDGWSCANGDPAGTSCELSLGSLSAGSSGSVNFEVLVDDPLPPGVVEITNTATIADDGTHPCAAADPNDGAANPDVAYNETDDEYLVVWQEGPDDTDEILGRRVDPGGSLVGTEVGVSDIAATGAGRAAANPALAYNSLANNYLVVWEGNGVVSDPTAERIFGQVVNADGTPDAAPDFTIAFNRVSRPDVAYNSVDDEHLVVFQAETVLASEIYGQRVSVDASGVTIEPRFRISNSTQARSPAVAHSDGNNQYLVVWQADRGSLQHEIFGRLVSGPGVLLGGGDAQISSTISDAGGNRDSALPAVAYDGAEKLFLVTYEADGLPNIAGGDDNDNLTEVFGQFTEPFFPDLRLTKDDGGVTAAPGAMITYTLNFGNFGEGSAPNAVITETVPANTTFDAGASTPNWSCLPDDNAGAQCTIEVGTLLPGQNGSVDFAVTVDAPPLPAGIDEISNTASIADDASGGADQEPTDNEASDTTPVDAAPDLQITKDDAGVTAVPGGTIVYTLSYANVGDQDATGVTINETVPANSTFNAGASAAGWSCADGSGAGTACTLSIGDLSATGGGAVSFAVRVDDPLPAGARFISNAATIDDDDANGDDPNPGDNSDGVDTPVDAAPDLRITKDDGDATAGPGDTVVYTLSYANAGNQGATGATITETVPAKSTFDAGASTAGWSCGNGSPAGTACTFLIGGVAAGGGGAVSFAVRVDNPVPAGVVEISNTASIDDDGTNGADANPGDNSDTETTPVGTPDLRVTKDDGGISAVPGDTVVYTLDYANVGDRNATGVSLSDTVLANSTFNAGASTPGWSCANGSPAGTLCTLPIGDLVAGGNGLASFAVTVDDPVPAGVVEIANTASIGDDGANGADPNPADNSDGDSTPVDAAPDLRVVKDDGGINAAPGDSVVYTLSFTNAGNQGATGAAISETVPLNSSFDAGASTAEWSCADGSGAGTLCTLPIGGIPAGVAGSVSFAVRVDDPVAAGVDEIANAAAIADDGANGADANPADNSDGDTTPVDAAPDLQVVKDDGGISAVPGDTVAYTLNFANAGNQGATGAAISETVPTNSSFDAGASTAGWSCADGSPGGTLCTLPIGGIPAGVAGSVSFAVRVDDPVAAGVDEIANAAAIADDGANGADANPADNSDGDTTPVDAAPDLQVAKDDVGISASPGDTVVYALSYANVGNQGATVVQISETVPADSTFNAGVSTPGWSCADGSIAGTACTLTVGALGGGEADTASFAVTLDNPVPDTVTEIANAASIADDGLNGADSNPADNSDIDTTPVLTPEEQAQALLEFIDDAVADGTLTGSGPGGSADGRLGALINKIETARALAAKGKLLRACSQLRSALLRTDGLTPPPDFVEGEAAEVLAEAIRRLQTRVGCP
jgi:uncharacterized repeat protein (TIGR01451 family)